LPPIRKADATRRTAEIAGNGVGIRRIARRNTCVGHRAEGAADLDWSGDGPLDCGYAWGPTPRGATMQCPQCRHENASSVKFCGECGVRLAAATPPASAVEPAATASTAAPVAAGPSDDATSLDSKYSSPQAYTPKHLVEKILTSKSALEGERKRVTVMFVDVC